MGETSEYPTQLELKIYPDPLLRRPARPVTVFDAALRDFCQRMLVCMDAHKGAGLAATQVGVDRRIFVTNHRRGDGVLPEYRVWINPRFSNPQGSRRGEEGCLSLPGIWAEVTRPASLDVDWQDETGTSFHRRFDAEAGEFLAVVVQHEADHLEARLFIDHLDRAALMALKPKLKDLERAWKKRTGLVGAVLGT